MTTENWENAKEVQSNWFKFEKVGDKIKGTLLGKKLQPGQGAYPDQWIYQLKCEDGNIWNVGISVNKIGTIERMNNVKIGEIVGIVFHNIGEPPKKGYAPVKMLKVYSFGMDPNYNDIEIEEEINM